MFACLLELAFTKKVYKEDERLHHNLLQLMATNPPNRREVIAMDIIFADLMRIQQQDKLYFFLIPARMKNKGNFPRSIFPFHLAHQHLYESIYMHEGVTSLPARLANRALKFHTLTFQD